MFINIHVDYICGLIGCQETLDVVDASGKSALMYAIYFGQFKVADGLVKKGMSFI